MSKTKFDSIIFDMDGTLWDAVDSYCKIWNITIAECGISHDPVSRRQLISLMGTTLDKIIDIILPEVSGSTEFLKMLDRNEQIYMPRFGGKLYDGVAETMPRLAEDYRLFMVSNCSSHGLPNFLHFTGLAPYISGTLSNGDTGLGKAENISAIAPRHGLQNPLYIGDTQGDSDACRRAGVEFAWASYGFGAVENPRYTLSTFSDILKIV